ncbi:MAG TPA: SigE family RNA polymerase sigma factor [Mycobacteriales bacterium]|jgi:RNA polymerase sigma-70 factor (sigma-E family)|nr:SigE family RNA polymerase sigma factor [Mycobacteriales bacterium]
MSDQTFQEFVLARGPELTRFATLLCRDRTEAEDLVQDTLASAYASWRRIEAATSPEAYVRRMLVNRHVSWWRRHRGRVEPRAVVPDVSRPDHTDHFSDTDAVRRMLLGLPPKQRAAVVLRYYADYSDAQIADTLGCSEPTVRSQISRALAALRSSPEALPERTRT